MKYTLAFALLFAPALASGVAAEDGHVSPSTLSALGLPALDLLSDAEGLQVRGQSAEAATRGTSLVAGLVFDPVSTSFLSGSDTDLAASTADGTKGIVVAQAHVSALDLTLAVGTGSSAFLGVLVGGAGGFSQASN